MICEKNLLHFILDKEEMNNFNLFFSQDIIKLTDNEGITLVQNYSYYYLITKILEKEK